MKVFCYYLKKGLAKQFSLDVDVFVSKKKKHVHIVFEVPISDCDAFDKLIDFILKELENRKVFPMTTR